MLQAYFWNDDFVWLYLLSDAPLAEVLFTPIGGHTVVARNALFALLHATAGLDPRPYFATVLATHVLNVLLLHRLVRLLTGSVLVAGLGALAWGTCPAAGATLSWYSVYAQVAATTCVLMALCRVAACADRGVLRPRDLVWVGVWLSLGSLFFGTALTVALLLPGVVVCLVPGSLATGRDRRRVVSVSATILLLYGALHLFALSAYAAPAVLVDELRSLAHGSWAAVAALVQLLRVGIVSVLFGAWWRPAPGADRVSWLTLALALVAWVAAVRGAPPRPRGRLLGLTLLALGVYALIAAARAPMLSAVFGITPAQVGATLRYHYTAQALLVAALSVALDAPPVGRSPWAHRGLAAWGIVLLGGLLSRGVPIDTHAASRTEVTRALDTLGARIAAAPPGTAVYVDNTPLAAFGWLPNTTVPLPGLAALFVVASPTDAPTGRPVRFVERNAGVYARFTARAGSRLARLLVPAPDGGG